MYGNCFGTDTTQIRHPNKRIMVLLRFLCTGPKKAPINLLKSELFHKIRYTNIYILQTIFRSFYTKLGMVQPIPTCIAHLFFTAAGVMFLTCSTSNWLFFYSYRLNGELRASGKIAHLWYKINTKWFDIESINFVKCQILILNTITYSEMCVMSQNVICSLLEAWIIIILYWFYIPERIRIVEHKILIGF